MSNAMRKGKRTLAGVAAGALGLALIPFVGVGTASADLSITASQNVIRDTKTAGLGAPTINITASAATTIPVSGATGQTGTGAVGILINSAPAGATPAAGNVQAVDLSSADLVAGVAKPTVVLAAFSAPGTYTATVWLNTNAAGSATTIDAGEPTTTLTIRVGGAPSSVQLTPSSLTLGAGGANGAFTIGLTDASGVATAVAGVETVSVTANAGTGTAPTIATASFATAAGDPGDSTYASALNPTSATAGTYSYSVSAVGVASPATLNATVVAASAAATALALDTTAETATLAAADFDYVDGATTAAAAASSTITYSQVNPDRKSFVVRATGDANAAVSIFVTSGDATTPVALPGGVTVDGVAVTNALPSAAQQFTAIADANGIASFAVEVGTATADTQLLFLGARPAAGAANGSPSLGLKYVAPVVAATQTGTATVAAVGASVPLTVTVADQYDNPVSGYLVTAQSDVTTPGTGGPTVGTKGILASGATGADGSVTLNVAAAEGTVNGTVANVLYSVTTNTGAALPTPISGATAFAVTYTTGGQIDSLTTTLPTTEATAAVRALPNAVAAPVGTALPGAATDTAANFTMAATPATSVTLSAPADVYMKVGAPTAWNDGASLLTVASTDTVTVWATKPGTYAITASAGGQTATGYVKVDAAVAASARNISLSPDSGSMPPGSITAMVVSVTDVLGNPVAAAAGTLTATVSGPGFINGSLLSLELPATNASGQTAFTVTVPNTVKDGTVTVTVTAVGGGGATDQWGAAEGYIVGSSPTSTPVGTPVGGGVVGFPASVASDAGVFEVGSVIVSSIIIEGEREGRRIAVIGETQGIAEGTIVRPWIRFPGETSYNLGAAQRSVSIVDAQDEIGEFAWGRRTGKRTAVIFRTEDQSVSSTRIIIPAR